MSSASLPDRYRRAMTEDFSVDRRMDGDFEVTNGSHETPGRHVYTVAMEDEAIVDCSCPDSTYRRVVCKHQLAVQQHLIDEGGR
ncbi:SWIM zinc finger family protein [Halomarina litorea]|uniref:SWIM zinc finger family protein n=1 Tax=Halomarina litorea TaxID=2961595 RepID=UPI0020C3E86D|nr:SWIM zinc finger family protein [Halomarina sp. BCD28]